MNTEQVIKDALSDDTTIIVTDKDYEQLLADLANPPEPNEEVSKVLMKTADGSLVPLNKGQAKKLLMILEEERRSKRKSGELLALLTGVAAIAPPGAMESYNVMAQAERVQVGRNGHRTIRSCRPHARPTQRRNDKCACGSQKKYKVCCFTKGE